MTFKKIKTGLGLTALALGLMGSSAAQAGFSSTEIQLHYGGGFKMGSNASFGSGFSETTDRAVVTVEHFSTNDLGDLFFFVDAFTDNNSGPVPAGNVESDQYGEIYYHLHGSKLGLNLGDGFISGLDFGIGINEGKDFTVALAGPRLSFNVPGFAILTLGAYAYNNVVDPFDRNLHTTSQITAVWLVPFSLGSQKFAINGFIDVIGSQGAGVDNQVIFSPQIRWDIGNAMGRNPGKINLGIEYTHFQNKFGITGVNEDSATLFLGFKF